MRQFAAHVGRRLVLAQTFIDHLAQQIVAGPGEIFHLNHKLGHYPTHAAEPERRSEAAVGGGGGARGIVSVAGGWCFRNSRCNSATPPD